MKNDHDGFKIIGRVRSPLQRPEDCPRREDQGPPATLEILPEYREALEGMRPGQKITLITWLHLAGRSTLGHTANPPLPPRGVFCSHSPDRPNPIGLHRATVTGLDLEASCPLISLEALEAIDGTPVLDIKTDREDFAAVHADPFLAQGQAWRLLARLCRLAGNKGFFPGRGGNASLRLGEYCLITKKGAIKSRLKPDDFTGVRLDDGLSLDSGKGSPSSELRLHLEIYRNQPQAVCVLHTHPPALLALSLKRPGAGLKDRLNLPLYEAQTLLEQIAALPRLAPGGHELGLAAGLAAKEKSLIWMEAHGLAAWGETPEEALALTDEAEHLARIALEAWGTS
ncbi:MAG: TrmO family methyltransferase [Desulfovibrionaceae bacterium]|nr:TrmO family methyltransferase [Desulfovibrionaceae bacterium]